MEDTRFTVSIHIMTSLAFQQLLGEGGACTSQNSNILAEGIKTNPAFIRKLMAKLVKAGLVESKRGKAGGVSLAKPAKDISLKEIYLAAQDGTLVSSHDKAPAKHCPVSCSMKKILHEVVEGVK